MKKFIVVYHAPSTAMEQMKDKTPEEMKEGMKPWMEWAEKCGDKLVDLGAPLGNGQKVTKTGTEASDNEVVGYSILQADNIEEAVAALQDHPHLAWTDGCEIEVYEAFELLGA